MAALLIPLDFFAYYISGGFPPGSGPTVWLAASLVCLGAYLLAAYWLQAAFLAIWWRWPWAAWGWRG
ncbi:MAG: hypothetical protein M5U34_20470 [Chloroflexi bacterium]|nr:hypothetical protein [Chloroflexota bacterium]